MSKQLDRLLSIMARLRDPHSGCEWDRAQDFSTIAPYTIEEAYEVADAIERGDMDDLRGELGDLLLQVVFHARMAEEAGHFDFGEVAQSIAIRTSSAMPSIRQAGRRSRRANGRTGAPRARSTGSPRRFRRYCARRNCRSAPRVRASTGPMRKGLRRKSPRK